LFGELISALAVPLERRREEVAAATVAPAAAATKVLRDNDLAIKPPDRAENRIRLLMSIV
jgi:hypothetical protein